MRALVCDCDGEMMPPRMILCLLVCTGLMLSGPAPASSLDKAINAAVLAQSGSSKNQKTIDKITDETAILLERYRATMAQVDALRSYNAQLENLLESQRSEQDTLQAQIDGITTTGREMVPLMQDMLSALEQFIQLDVPFLEQERAARLKGLKAMMARADVTHSEKFRRILEAYQIENEYGRTIETYQASLSMSDKPRTVQFLRVGRVVLVYQTLDGQESGVWNQKTRTFDVLPSEYSRAISKGMRIALKQAPPDLLRLPVMTPEGGK